MKKNNKNTHKKSRENGQIMGINVLSTDIGEVLASVEKFIPDSSELGSRSSKFYIVTPNPELILMAQKVPNLKKALNEADLSIPDGVGLKLAIPNLNIIKGRELFLELIKLAGRKGWKVFLLGGLGDEAELAARQLTIDTTLRDNNQQLTIRTDKGPKLDNNAEPVSEIDKKLQKDAIDKINKFAPDLLFVAFGNPKQEIWIHENYRKLNIGGAMAVGGAFRYVVGLSKLPPKWMASIGLEWLYRLITEPRRIGRIFNAVIVFPVKVFFYKINH